MDKPRIDPERIAALMEGRLSRAERRALINELAAADPETLSALGDAAVITGEFAPDERFRLVVPVDRVARRSWSRVAWIAVAAGVVGIAVAVPLLSRGAGASDEPGRFAAMLTTARIDATAAGLWATRGGESASGLERQAAGIRAGAGITDLAVALRVGRDDAAREAAVLVVTALTRLDGSGGAVAQYRQIASSLEQGGRPAEGQLRAAAESARSAAGEAPIEAGAWIEAARIAARQRDQRFFEQSESRETMEGLASRLDWPASAGEPYSRARALMSEPTREWPALAGALTDLLTALGD